MNGYKAMADSYRKAAGENKIPSHEAEKQAKIYDFLATCDNEDINTLFDSTAFNEIAKNYLRLAVKRLTVSGKIDGAAGTAITNEYFDLFEDLNANEVYQALYGADK